MAKVIEYDLNKLRGRIVEVFKTQKAFAEALGVSERTMVLKLSGERYFTLPEIEEAAKLLKIAEADIQEYFFTQKVQKS